MSYELLAPVRPGFLYEALRSSGQFAITLGMLRSPPAATLWLVHNLRKAHPITSTFNISLE